MPDYKKLYHKLFNDITDTIEQLKQSQIDAEKMYLDMCEKEDESNLSYTSQPVFGEDLKK